MIYQYKCSQYSSYKNWVNIHSHKPSNCTVNKDCTVLKLSNNPNVCAEGLITLDWIDILKFHTILCDGDSPILKKVLDET